MAVPAPVRESNLLGSIIVALAMMTVSTHFAVADDPPQGTAQFSLRPPRSRQVSALVIYDTDAGAVGKVEPVKVTINPDDSKSFRVGIYEDEVGGSGNIWRASAWMATAAAAQVTGFNPSARHVTFDIAGTIDGPSAGGILTVGILAAIRGDDLRSDAAMTGMINPDYSIGPVGGIPHKIQGAAQAGKKMVLIPAVSRTDFDKNLGKEVDLIQLGKSLGVEVKPVSDLYDAYRALTNKELPRLPQASGEPSLSPQAARLVDSRTREWLARFGQVRSAYDNLPDEAKNEGVVATMTQAIDLSERSARFLREGEIVAAQRDAFEATYTGTSATECARLNDVQSRRGLEQMIKEAKTTSNAWSMIDLGVNKLRGIRPASLQQAGCYMDAFSCLIEAIYFSLLADQHLKHESMEEGDKIYHAQMAATYYQYSLIDLMGMDENLQDLSISGGPPAPAEEQIALAANLYRHVAAANLTMFETMHIEQIANKEGMALQVARKQFMDKDLSYAQLKISIELLKVLRKHFGDGLEMHYATLTAMRDAYILSTMLIAKSYSLETVEDEDKNVISVGREKTLRTMLEFADDQARRGIAHLERHGVDASGQVSNYLVGRMKRERSVSEKIDALQYFWNAHLSCQILAFLGGFPGVDQ